MMDSEEELVQRELRLSQDQLNPSHSAQLSTKAVSYNAESKILKNCMIGCGSLLTMLRCLCASCNKGPTIVIQQGHIGLRISLGKFIQKIPPGIYSFNSCTEKILVVDCRTQLKPISTQILITRDNISLFVDAFVQYRIKNPEYAIFKVENYEGLIDYTAQGTIKTIFAEHTLSEILEKRAKIENEIALIIAEKIEPFGIKIAAIETPKIRLPQQLEKAMANVAQSYKEGEAKLIGANGNFESAKLYRQAAEELGKNELALTLQYFETMKYIASDNNESIILPNELIEFIT